MTDNYIPKPENKFTFGLWTVGNTGRDPFGGPVRDVKTPVELVHLLADVGAWGVNFHDNDLVPIDATPTDRDCIVRDFKAALAETGLVVPMATTNLFTDPAFKDGAFTSNDPKVRAYAMQKTLNAIDLGAELGAKVYVFWGGREGTETDAAKDPITAIHRSREAMNFLCEYVIDRKYDLKFALEAKPNEPRGDMYNATTGHMLAFIQTLEHPEMVGVNPEMAHEHMAGLNFTHGVAQAMEAGKLFHIDLNDQAFGRYDQDYRFGTVNLKSAFFLVKLLEDHQLPGQPALRCARLPHGGLRRRKRLCARLHAHVFDPQGKGGPVECGPGDTSPGGRDQCRRRFHEPILRKIFRTESGDLEGKQFRPTLTGSARPAIRTA